MALKIVFMGTPEIAVATLKTLIDAGKDIKAVVTAPDKPAGRGLKVHQPAVKQFAAKHKLPVLQPPNLKDPDFQSKLTAYNPDLLVVVAFRILPQSILDIPSIGSINLHASLLPQYRGAAPINWAIINGENQSGVTTFFIKQKVDTGEILFQESVDITPEMTAGELHDVLMEEGARLMLQTVNAIETGNYQPQPQPVIGDLKLAPKIFREDCKLISDLSVQEAHNFVRGLSPYPGAWTILDGQVLKIYRATIADAIPGVTPGQFVSDGKHYLRYALKNGSLDLLDVQLAGKKRMAADALIRGYDLGSSGIILR